MGLCACLHSCIPPCLTALPSFLCASLNDLSQRSASLPYCMSTSLLDQLHACLPLYYLRPTSIASRGREGGLEEGSVGCTNAGPGLDRDTGRQVGRQEHGIPLAWGWGWAGAVVAGAVVAGAVVDMAGY